MRFRKTPVLNTTPIAVVFVSMTILMALIVLIGWSFNTAVFSSGRSNIKANTAIGLLLSGVTLLLFIRNKNAIAFLLVTIILSLGIISLSEYFFNWNAHIDELFFSDKNVNAGKYPGRMAILTCFAVITTGISLLSYPFKHKRLQLISEFSAVLLFTMSLTGFLASLYNANQVSRVTNLTSFSIPSSFGGLLLSMAILFSRQNSRFIGVFAKQTNTAKAGIRGILAVIIILVFIGWLCLKGIQTGVFQWQMGIVVMITTFIISFVVIVGAGIRRLNIAENKLVASEKNLRQVLSSTGDIFYVIDKNYKITLLNEVAVKNLSKAWGKPITLDANVLDLIPKGVDEPVKRSFEKVLTGTRVEYELHNVLIKDLPEWVMVNYHPVKDDHGTITGAYVVTKDITEKRKAEQELKQSNNRFELISRTTNDAIWEWNLETGELWSNETHQQLYGLGIKDPVPTKKMWLERVHPDDKEIMEKRQNDALLSDKNVFISEYRFKAHEEEGYRNIYDRCYIVRKEGGMPIRMMGSMIDITEQKKIENELRKSEERYRTLVENAPEALVMFDLKKGKFVSVSESAVILFKMSKDELLEVGPLDVSPIYQPNGELSSEMSMEKINEAVQGGKPSFEWTHSDKYGNQIPCEVRLVRLPSEDNILIRGSIIDISERKKAEEEIKKEKELSDTMIDSLPGIFYLYDATGKFIRWNKQLEIISGYSGNEIAGMHPIQFFEGEEIAYITEKIQGVFVKGSEDAEAHFVTKEKIKIPFYFKAVRIEYEGEPCLLGYGIDISDRKLAEKELLHSYDQIRRLSDHLQNIREEERTHIAREIHDELGQQLTVLKMDASWLNKRLASADETVGKKLEGLMDLLNDTVKTVRRISSELRPSLLDDMGLVAAIEWHLKEFEKRASIKTEFKPPGEELSLSDGIKTGLFRIFQESLTNVAKHAGAKTVKVSLKKENGNVVLSITDHGQGFEQEKVTNKKTLGILGMKERTFMMGGTYQIKSKPGKGTVVIVAVPYNEQEKT